MNSAAAARDERPRDRDARPPQPRVFRSTRAQRQVPPRDREQWVDCAHSRQRRDAPPQTLGFAAKPSGPVAKLDQLQGVDCGVPFRLRLLQGQLQLPGAAYAAAHQDEAAKRKGYSDDHSNRREEGHTKQQANKPRGAREGARASGYGKPAALLDRLAKRVDLSLEPLDLIGGRRYPLRTLNSRPTPFSRLREKGWG